MVEKVVWLGSKHKLHLSKGVWSRIVFLEKNSQCHIKLLLKCCLIVNCGMAWILVVGGKNVKKKKTFVGSWPLCKRKSNIICALVFLLQAFFVDPILNLAREMNEKFSENSFGVGGPEMDSPNSPP